MGLSAAQQHLPLSTGPRPVAPVFAVAVEPVSADPARPVDPDIGDRIAGVQVDLHEEFARLKANKWRAVNVAASAEYAGGDTAEIALEALSTYLQNGNATMRLIGLAIEAGTISSDIYTDRFAANDPAFDPHKEAEQQAMKKIMTPESGDPNAQSLFGAKRQLEERESSLTFRFNRLPPGASDILEAANDPDFELEYRPLAAGQDLTWPGRKISL